MRLFKGTFIVLLILLVAASSFAQKGKYQRKSISYLSVLLQSSDDVNLSGSQQAELLSSIRKYIELDRFDYNPLSKEIVADFVNAAHQKRGGGALSMDDIAGLMESTLVPQIVKILEATGDTRAIEAMNPSQRQGFLASKAKEIGFSVDDLEKVWNAAYIYVPVVSEFSMKTDKDGNETAKMKGGVIWYHITWKGNTPVVELVSKKTTSATGMGDPGEAFDDMKMVFGKNIQTLTRDIKDFTLHAQIRESNGKIGFNLGKKEGLGFDEVVLVGEWVVDSKGKEKFSKRGYGRVGKVADNKAKPDALSYAWKIKGGSWDRGMTVVEHPRLGIDIAFKPAVFTQKMTTGMLNAGASTIDITEDESVLAPGLDLDFHTNIAKVTMVPQLFFTLGGHLSFPLYDFADYTDEDLTTSAMTYGFHGGLLKRTYMGPLALDLEAKFGFRYFSITQSYEDSYGDEYDYELTNSTGGLQASIGLNYSVNPDVNFGAYVGYGLYAVSEKWKEKFSINDEEQYSNDIEDITGMPEVHLSGAVIGIYFHWSPMTLGYNPAAAIERAAKKNKK